MKVNEKEIVKDTEGNERGLIEVGLTPQHLTERAEKSPEMSVMMARRCAGI
jgi:CO dehydrogenase/acetyl-CoA synthase alpha subunit